MNIESSTKNLSGILIDEISTSDFRGSVNTPVIAEIAAVSGEELLPCCRKLVAYIDKSYFKKGR